MLTVSFFRTLRRQWILVVLLFSGAAQAIEENDPQWRVTLSPYLWMAGARGDGELGPASGHLRLPFHDVVKNLRFAALGSIEVSHGSVGGWLNSQYLDVAHDMTFAGGGGTLQAHATVTRYSLGGYWRAWSENLFGLTLYGQPQQMSFSPLIGMRMTRLKASLRDDGASFSRRADWMVPLIGARMMADLTPRWLLSAEVDAGAWGKTFSTQGQIFAGYRMRLLGQPAVLQMGWQILHEDYQERGFHWDVSQYGPLAGLSVTF